MDLALTSLTSRVCRCIPFRYINSDENDSSGSGKVVQVLMISSSSGPGLLFPKVPATTIPTCF